MQEICRCLSKDILAILTHDLWTLDIFSFICVFFNFFSQCLNWVSSLSFWCVFTSLVKFTAKYFIIFDAILHGIVHLLLDKPLLVYKNAAYLCMLNCILKLLNSFIGLTGFFFFFGGIIRIFYIQHYIISQERQITSFPIWIPWIFFLIGLTRSSNTMLNRSGESGHPCLTLFKKIKYLFIYF